MEKGPVAHRPEFDAAQFASLESLRGEDWDEEPTQMVESSRGRPNFTEADLDFVVGEAAPDAPNGERLKELGREDENFRKAMVGDDRVFERLMSDEEIFVKVSPALYFEVLLRRAHKEIELATHTVERTGRQNIPVFDTQAVVGLLARPQVLEYLSQMLASFMRIRSYVVPLQPRGGIRRRVRFNDMDIDSLLHFCAQADEQQRLSFYKRIADVCLFVSGVFPDHSLRVYRQAATTPRGPRPMRPSRRALTKDMIGA